MIANRAKAIAHKVKDTFVSGDVAGDADSFDGIRKLIPVGQTVDQTTNGATISLPKLDELVDKVKSGKPDVLLMSPRTRRGLKQARRACPVIENHVDQFGQQVETYDGIPIIADDFVPDNEVQGSSGAVCASVFALKFGMSIGLMGGP